MGRVGTKRGDRRWRSDDGRIWASKFEYQVFDAFTRAGCDVRPCDARDTVNYVEPRRNSRCLECSSSDIVQDRSYTPDLCVNQAASGHDESYYFVEVKGYFPATRRKLFRDYRNAVPSHRVRIVFEKDGWVTKGKSKYSDYCDRYLKDVPYHVWVGDKGHIPPDWL